jgi:epoxyqueuosine reductase
VQAFQAIGQRIALMNADQCETDRVTEHTRLVLEKARALGFDAVGIVSSSELIDEDFARYEQFLARGYHGDMGYLEEHRDARRSWNTNAILDGAQSLICVALKYRRHDEQEDPELAKRIARYARGQDYHGFLVRKLRKLAAFVRRLGSAETPIDARPLCDTAPMLERAWAVRAGLGFVGKNGLLIVPGQGSFVLLGEVATTLTLAPSRRASASVLAKTHRDVHSALSLEAHPQDGATTGTATATATDRPERDESAPRCGSCRLCLDACPTEAFPEAFVLDARKCIAYLTIETRSPVDETLSAQIPPRLFGCDDCQLVCPFNRGRDAFRTAPLGFAPLPRWRDVTLEDFLNLGNWPSLSEGTPVRRAMPEGMQTNARRLLEAERDKSRPEEHATHRSDH